MALINCPECGIEVSDKAAICPKCGYPIALASDSITSEKECSVVPDSVSNQTEDASTCPTVAPDNLDNIGLSVKSLGFPITFTGVYDGANNTIPEIYSGEIEVELHTHGIKIFSYESVIITHEYKIHSSQIIKLYKTTSSKHIRKNKSVVGRSVAGGLISGPVGAVVGGVSALNAKKEMHIDEYLVIEFWDIASHTPLSIKIHSQNNDVDTFIILYNDEQERNKTDKRIADGKEESILPTCGTYFIIGIVLVLILILCFSLL